MERKLRPKQKKFCEEYLIDLNATQAAIRAGYSKKTAFIIGHENLRKPNIDKYLKKIMAKRSDEVGVTSQMVLDELRKMAFVSESDFYKDDGSCKLLSELTKDQKSALKSYTTRSVSIGDGEYEEVPVFQVHDKQKSLEMFMKHLGLYEKDNTRTVVVDMESTVLKGL